MANEWFDNVVTSPAAGSTVVTTGQKSAGNYTFMFVVHSTLAGQFEVQQLDSGNAVQHRQRISVLANESTLTPNVNITLASNDTVKIVSSGLLSLGVVSASIFAAN